MNTAPDPLPWLPGDASVRDVRGSADPRRHAPATARNRDAILMALRAELPNSGTILEIASGSGEHIVFFATAMPHLNWVPSDPDPAAIASIAAYAKDAGLNNMTAPIALDASASWTIQGVSAILCINMVHIAPWSASKGLFAGAARCLPSGAPLVLYGPFIESGIETTASNQAFDAGLRERNPDWGLRDSTALDRLAAEKGLRRAQRLAMPANNLMLVWRRA